MRPPELDVGAYLEHEGISPALEDIAVPDAEAGTAILGSAADRGADLIVMGAYGHSRFREWILGGATRHVLEHMQVPVFMAHQ